MERVKDKAEENQKKAELDSQLATEKVAKKSKNTEMR
jgi:hypothetical protein